MAESLTSTISKIVESARKWIRRAAHSGLLAFHLGVTPTPASRPRVTRFGVYYGKNYTKFFKAAVPVANTFDGVPTDKPVVMLIEVVADKPKTGKSEYPRGDIDNFVKGPMDVLTKTSRFWNDDNQVVGLLAFKRYPKPGEKPGVNIEWFPLEN
jgi:Holliday junction resolvase RusA-like endonuclease